MLLSRLALPSALLLGVTLVPATAIVPVAYAAEPAATTLTLTGDRGRSNEPTALSLALHADSGPVAQATVRVERRVDGAWRHHADATTSAEGAASLPATLRRDPDDNVFRASFAGDDQHTGSEAGPVQVALLRHASVVTLGGPDQVVDEQRVTLNVRWRTASGMPVPGSVRVFRRKGDRWVHVLTVATGGTGRASFSVRPRSDSRWRVKGLRQAWVARDVSNVHRIDNLPPGVPVRLPAGAPAPSVSLPAQPRPTKAGPDAVVTRIPDRVWGQMVGVSWHRGCPVGRSGLRLLRVNYWDYTGYRRRGEIVVNADVVGRVSGALRAMYRQKLPIRSMYRVDRFGWSDRLNGGNDYRSMATGNTSGFNCRDVVGRPGVRSPHSWGRAIDVNPWENPYWSGSRWLPNAWWTSRSHPRVAWRSRDHRVVRLMANHGLRWTYGTRDAHHFDARR